MDKEDNLKCAIVSLGGKSSLMVAESCKNYFNEVDSLNLKNFEVHITDLGISLSYEGQRLKDYDCVYIRGSYRYALLQRALVSALRKKSYMPIQKEGFAIGHDKFLTLVELQKSGVNVPKTYYAATTALAKQLIEKEVSYPLIMKVPRGTHGKGVMVADSVQSAKSILDMLEHFNEPYIMQEFIKTDRMSDIRAVVVGKKVVASYERVACAGEVRANVHLGGKRHAYQLTKEEERLAINSAKAIDSEICGVDILKSKSPSVIEVNLSPGISAIQEVSGVDVVNEISKFLYHKTLKFKKAKGKRSGSRVK